MIEPRRVSIEGRVAELARLELQLVRQQIRPEPADYRARRKQAQANRRRLVKLTRELYGVMRSEIPRGGHRRELAASLRELQREVLWYCDQNARPWVLPRSKGGRPTRTPFNEFIHRLVRDRGLSAREASKQVARILIDVWKPTTLTDEEFDRLFPSMVRPEEKIEAKLAAKLRVIYVKWRASRPSAPPK